MDKKYLLFLALGIIIGAIATSLYLKPYANIYDSDPLFSLTGYPSSAPRIRSAPRIGSAPTSAPRISSAPTGNNSSNPSWWCSWNPFC